MAEKLPATVGSKRSLPKELESLLETPTIWNSERGDVSAGVWARPEKVPPTIRSAAAAEHRAMLPEMGQATADTVRKWLKSLAILVCSRAVNVADAELQMAAYSSLLSAQHPKAVYSAASLERAGRAFKWLPSYSEVAEFLDQESVRVLERHDRLRRLSLPDQTRIQGPQEPGPDRWQDLSPEQQARHEAMMAEFYATFGKSR